MKAILVIDLPEDMRIEDTQALNVTLYNGLFVREMAMNRPLKPLPEKMEEDTIESMMDDYSIGWNDCLKEIEE